MKSGRQIEWSDERGVSTSAYLATELASTAYTFRAPAWMAKKDKIPVPQPTSSTTCTKRDAEKYLNNFYDQMIRRALLAN